MSREFWTGLIVGAIVGGITGVMLAPGPGYDSRRRVSRVARTAGGKVAGAATTVQSKAQQAVTAIRQAI